MRRLPEEMQSGLPQPGDRHYDSYVRRMRDLLNTRMVALTTPDPIPLHIIVAWRFVPRPSSKAVRLQVRLEDNSEHILDGGAHLYSVVEQGFLPDPRKADPHAVRWDGVWHAYYPEQWAIPASLLTKR